MNGAWSVSERTEQFITDALTQWTFTPYEVNGQRLEVETGILFGYAPPWPKREKGSPEVAADQ